MSDNTSATGHFHAYPKRSITRWVTMQGVRLVRSFLRTTQVAPLALLVDGENIAADLIGPILVEAGNFGCVTTKRVYGNWTQPSMQRWKEMSLHYGLQQIHHTEITASHKNAADIALVVDAMDMFYRDHIDHFCIVTSDSDYTPLVQRLRSAGCIVLGIGRATTSPALTRACTTFVTTEQIIPPQHQPKPVTHSPTHVDGPTLISPVAALYNASPSVITPLVLPPTVITKLDPELIALLTKAYKKSSEGKESEWVLISRLGLALRQLEPNFDANKYGQKDLSSLVRMCEGIFELRKRSTGHPEMRMVAG
ncbi:MAG: NYN domain-containing protein [Ktedonobacteraceae bacterium]